MGIGSPSYATPYPVKQPDGSQVIWDWKTKSWGPYTPPDPNAVAPPPPSGEPPGGPDGRGGGPAPASPSPSEPPAPKGETMGLAQRRRRTAGGTPYGPGTSLLTLKDV